MGINLGIDLGTTYTVCSFNNGKEFKFIKDESGSTLIPSVVGYSGKTLVGKDAVDNEENDPHLTIRSSKRLMGKNISNLLSDEIYHKPVSPLDVATEILKYVKTLAETQSNQEIDGAVITVPAYFNQNQRLDTKIAAESSGLNVLRIINEPTAAALAYGEDTKEDELVLVYDLGGGTFDVTVLQLSSDNVYHVLSTKGDTALGGDDLDEIIVDVFIKSLPKDFKPFKDFKVRLKKFAEEVKIQLNYKKCVKKTLKYAGTIYSKIYHHEFEITSDEYLKLIEPICLKTKSYVLSALNDANKKISNLSKIILVGGSTKSTFIREFVSNSFKTKVFYEIDPDLTVSLGAATLADSITRKNSDSAILIDVTPLSLGIETKGGLMNKIIPRNTSIPVSSSQEYITAEDNQDIVNIRICQGEKPLVKDNELLGEFTLSGFEKRPKGQTKIVVKFDIDTSGLINVQAFDKQTGIQSEVTLNPLTSDKINNYMDKLEIISEDDSSIVEQIELESLREKARTLILAKKLLDKDNTEYDEIFESVKDNLNNLSVFIQSLKDD